LGATLDGNAIKQYEVHYILNPWVAQKALSRLVVDNTKRNYYYGTSGKWCWIGHWQLLMRRVESSSVYDISSMPSGAEVSSG